MEMVEMFITTTKFVLSPTVKHKQIERGKEERERREKRERERERGKREEREREKRIRYDFLLDRKRNLHFIYYQL